ncbi:farnesol dehydrogenase-like [Toxorhynchites rutilus septentrionalis]|uniref:farnesol dehydrogenase-like n=1 Tax=Toxorhynchites rutilus septentrionalis TaxID=329112 RepID=UPI002479BFD5|nr:farnesol dehydrogenase-like [Toxorhynchites rutilus septentrionalis]
MDRWIGKVAVVTGASAGIGSATVKKLIDSGLIVVGLARRVDRVEALKKKLDETDRDRLHAIKCDVSKESDIISSFRWIDEKLGGVHILINNAAVSFDTNLLTPGNTSMLRETLNTNVLGSVLCTREAFHSMKTRSVDGHIVYINSIAGHNVPAFPEFNIYPASKFAITAITETTRQELRMEGTKIKVTSISPGAVRTDMLPKEGWAADIATLQPEDIADAIVYVLGTPPHVQIHELTIKPVGEDVL